MVNEEGELRKSNLGYARINGKIAGTERFVIPFEIPDKQRHFV